MGYPPRSGKRGVAPIVGEVLLIAIVVAAIGVIAAFVLVSGTRERFVDLDVRLENTSPGASSSVKVILMHKGGDPLGIPHNSDDEFYVRGLDLENFFENRVPWDNWIFSAPANGFEFGENAVGILRHNNWNLEIGTELRITVYDITCDKLIFSRVRTIENSRLY